LCTKSSKRVRFFRISVKVAVTWAGLSGEGCRHSSSKAISQKEFPDLGC
jgi:hypothetical protein